MGNQQQTRPRRLLLCLDGVPHQLIEQAKSRGLFDAFGAPTRLLSPFPTMTNVALYLGLSPWRWVNGAIVLALAALTVMPVGFLYPNLAPGKWKAAILTGAFVWLVLIAAMLPSYPATPIALTMASLVYPLFYTVVSIIEFRRR